MYILECSDGSYYTGSTKSLDTRVAQHQNGEGANHTKKHLPVQLVYFEEFTRIDEAFYREKQVQGWNRKKKEALIKKQFKELPNLSITYRDKEVSASSASASVLDSSTSIDTPLTEALEVNIPQLRFPEFSGEWNERIISKIANKITDGTHDTPKPVKKGIPFLTAIHVKDGNIDFKNCYYLSKEEHDKIYKRCNPKFGDLLMVNIGAGTATSAMVNVDFEFSLKNVALIKPNKEKIDSVFFSQIQRRNCDRLRHQISSGGAQPFLSLKAIGKLKLSIPQIPEQQKIATFLTTVDTKLSQLTQKKRLLEAYKKGIMQQIFSQQLRFTPDQSGVEGKVTEQSRSYPDWEEKKLGEIGFVINGLTYSPNDINDNGVLVLRSSNVKARIIDLNDTVFVNVEEGKFNPVIETDILICVRNGSKRLIGKNAIIKKEHVGLAFGAFMTVYRSEYNKFLFHFFDSQHYKKEVHKNLGATINSINGSDLKKFKVPLPCLEEQIKIANFLSALDTKIQTVAEAIEATKTFKKGLLQQLFV